METMEKIKVEDLGIGDWVKMEDEHYQIYHLTLAGDVYGHRKVNITSSEEVFDGSIADVCPIPITAEILEKNGWSEFSDYHNSWKLDIASDKRVWMFKNSHDWTFQVMSWGLGHNHSVAKAYIKDIHELQHALRLAKVGKEIVL